MAPQHNVTQVTTANYICTFFASRKISPKNVDERDIWVWRFAHFPTQVTVLILNWFRYALNNRLKLAQKWTRSCGFKWLAQGHKGLTAHRCSFYFCFSPPNALIFVTDHTTKLGIKDLFKPQQLWIERYSNLIPPQYNTNALTTTPTVQFGPEFLGWSRLFSSKLFKKIKEFQSEPIFVVVVVVVVIGTVTFVLFLWSLV